MLIGSTSQASLNSSGLWEAFLVAQLPLIPPFSELWACDGRKWLKKDSFLSPTLFLHLAIWLSAGIVSCSTCEHRWDGVIEMFRNYHIFTQSWGGKKTKTERVLVGLRWRGCEFLIKDGRQNCGWFFPPPSWALMGSGPVVQVVALPLERSSGRLEAQSHFSKLGYFERCFLTL